MNFLTFLELQQFLMKFLRNTAAVHVSHQNNFHNVKINAVITRALICFQRKKTCFNSFIDKQSEVIVVSPCFINLSGGFEGLGISLTSFAPIFSRNVLNSAAISC